MPARYYDEKGNRVLNKKDLVIAMSLLRKLEYYGGKIRARQEFIGDPDSYSKCPVLSSLYTHLDRAVVKLVKMGALNRV